MLVIKYKNYKPNFHSLNKLNFNGKDHNLSLNKFQLINSSDLIGEHKFNQPIGLFNSFLTQSMVG
jgi:hypothetical protein